ncbi:MAG: PhoH family protein, partial [Spirochaetales bacterium]|nr:PhoH family protein [Candidatus Physcosoma equi]
LGFLPGDLSQKLNPYLRHLYDSMDLLLNPQQIKRLEENGTIEIAPLAYMRGRSLNNSIVILDEAQNTTSGQMRMFLTRIGESSTAVITGDPTQIDLPRKKDSGFTEAMRILDGIESLSVVRFSHRDTVRSRIVRSIVKAYSLEEENE